LAGEPHRKGGRESRRLPEDDGRCSRKGLLGSEPGGTPRAGGLHEIPAPPSHGTGTTS
jgi:hypothetical protein